MPDISNQIKFTSSSKKIISDFEANISLTYKNWGDPNLLPLRLEIRDFYRTEQKFECSYCRKQTSVKGPNNAQIDHIVPKSTRKEFLFHPKNLCVVCEDCNTSKGEKSTLKNKKIKYYPRSSNAFIIYHPHFDIYSNEIIVTNGIFYSGRTLKGRNTVAMCNLGRFHVALYDVEPELISQKKAQELTEIIRTSTDEFERVRALAQLGHIIQSNQT